MSKRRKDASLSTVNSEYRPFWEALQEENTDAFVRRYEDLPKEQQLQLLHDSHVRRRTLLHVACDMGMSEIVEVLLRSVADLPDRDVFLWKQDKKKWTALHYACLRQRLDIVRQLLRPWPAHPEDDGPNPPQSIPLEGTKDLLTLRTTLEIMSEILRHSRGNPNVQFHAFRLLFAPCILPKADLEDAVPIVVVGEKNSGKSTIIKTLQLEGAKVRIKHLFKNVRGVAQHKAGIIPTQVHQHSYLGRVVFYELSGNREFVHEAILEAGHLTDAVFLLVIDTREEIDAMTRQIVYWINFIRYHTSCQVDSPQPQDIMPNIIVTGSHKDVLPRGRYLAPNERFLIAFSRARHIIRDFRLITRLTMDCRKATAEMLHIQWKLYYELQRLRRHRSALPGVCYVLYSVIQSLCEQKKERAITLNQFVHEISTSGIKHYKLLPQNPEELTRHCEKLHQLNVLLLLADKDNVGDSWIITDPRPLLDQIEFALFSHRKGVKSAFQTTEEEQPERSWLDLALASLSDLKESFQMVRPALVVTSNADLLIKVMKHYKYCDEVVLPDDANQPAQTVFYIPHLLPQKLELDPWELPSDQYTYMCTWAMAPELYHYFMPHLVHKLLLHLSLSSIVPLHCSRSHRSLAWADPSSGVEVFISDYNSEVLALNVRCYKGKEIDCLKVRTAIIRKICSIVGKLDEQLNIREVVVPRSRVQRRRLNLPVTNPLHTKLKHCTMENIRDSVRNGRELVVSSDPATMVTLSDLLHFEPYSRVQKMQERLRAHLGNPEMRDKRVTEEFLAELLVALGGADIERDLLRLLLDLIQADPQLLPNPETPLNIASLAHRMLQSTHLTYSELREHLDSISIVKLSDFQ